MKIRFIYSALVLLVALVIPLNSSAKQNQYELTGMVKNVSSSTLKIGGASYKLSPVVKIYRYKGKTVLLNELQGKPIGATFEKVGKTGKQINKIWIIPESEMISEY